MSRCPTDNHDFKATLCAKRVNGVIHAWKKASWDGTGRFVDRTGLLDAARFRLEIKKSVSGTDPVVKSANSYGTTCRSEHGNTAGKGYRTTSFSASPVV
ncbi:hypothetical protein [Streptomyces prunicolor]|uniref:hypothetical protein n=1 Tax=Streptomyces prunicolor TaxID=67348 RepID=UPI0033EF0405